MQSLQSIGGYWFLFIITVIILVGLTIEAIRHRYYLKRIPIRVHVNGTRGKSSVTRLIAAGLRAGGIRTYAKTTGTLPQLILPDGAEEAIFRIGHTNILEQLKVIRRAVKADAEALVIECMAVHPLLQSLAELKIVQSTHGVLTNARPDHLDVMGPTEEDVALALAATVPVKGQYFTAETQHLGILKMAVEDRDSDLTHIDQAAIDAISDKEISAFSYAEFKENAALALSVCQSLGVDRQVALEGMWAATPDPGALSFFTIEYKGHKIIFANGFAANDPSSTEYLWHTVLSKYGAGYEIVGLVNCRADRKQRSQDLAKAFVDWQQPDRGIVIGSGTAAFLKVLKKRGIDPLYWTDAETWSVEQILDKIVEPTEKRCHLVVGIVNIAGIGLALLDYFSRHQVVSENNT